MTVAMLSARSGYIKHLPREFYHDPTIKDQYGRTVAMISAYNGYIKYLPQEFYHDATIRDNGNRTVAMIAAGYEDMIDLP